MLIQKVTFVKAYEDFLNYSKDRHKEQGFETKKRKLKLHILPYFENYYIQDLTKLDIINWQTAILSNNYTNSFNNGLYYTFSTFIEYCVNCGYLQENVVKNTSKFPKKIEIKEHDIYNIWEFRWFRFHLENYMYKQFFNFMYFLGTRPSEAMALKFSDLKGNTAYITKSIQRRGKRKLDTPKNQSSVREIKLNILMRYRLCKLRKLYVKKYNDPNYDYFLFGGKKPLSTTTTDRVKSRACKKANIREITQHEFRHSCASRLIHKHVSIEKVSHLLGHSKVSTTVDVYLHEHKKRVNKTLFRLPFSF